METNNNYMKGFIPYAIAAGVLSLCGGFNAAVPANITTAWDMGQFLTFVTLAYSLGAAALAPIMGKLGDVLGRRTTLLVAMGLYTLGHLISAILPDGSIYLLLLCRFMVGVGAAGIAPVVMAYIMMEFPPEKMGQGFTIYMLIACGMVVFGPTLGGIVLAKVGWRMVMWIDVAMCAASLLAVFLLIKKDNGPKKTLEGFDYLGAVCVLLFFSMVLCIPTFGQQSGWFGTPTVVCYAVALISGIALVMTEKKAQNPIINGAFMARKQFILPVIVLFLSQGLLQSCMTNIIVFSIMTTGDRTLSGIATSVMYIGMALGTIVLGPQADKKEPKVVAALALVFVAIGAGLQMLFSATTGLAMMCASMFFIGLGLGGNGTIFMKVVLSGCSPELAGSGSGTYNVFRDMSAPFGVAMFVPMFQTGLASKTAVHMGAGLDQAAATVAAAVDSLHSVALIQVVCVIVGIVVCMMLPKIYETKEA
ncbi:MAG: MFS transporter [Oscillospiraceae bacterium]|nr:MFS transporter [Oscillospiraceae bacterium]